MTTAGQLQPSDVLSDFNEFQFKMARYLARVRTTVLVAVSSFTPNTNPLLPGTVNVKPLVNMVDGAGQSTPHGTINNIPVWQFKFGINALIANPKKGDIGVLLVSDRDISSVKAGNGAVSNPGSFRRFDLADGIYIGGLFGAAPTQYLQFDDTAGFTLLDSSGNQIKASSTGINLTPKSSQGVTVSGPLVVTGDTTLEGNAHVTGTGTIDRAFTALSLGLISGGKITRLISGTFSGSGAVPAGGGPLIGTFSDAHIQAGDTVMLSSWTTLGQAVIQPVVISGGVEFFAFNPTAGATTATINTSLLVIGVT